MTIDTEPLTITHGNCSKLRVKTLRICGDTRKISLAILIVTYKTNVIAFKPGCCEGRAILLTPVIVFQKINTRKVITSPSDLSAVG